MPELRGKLEQSVNEMMTFSDPEFLARARAAGLENLSVVEDDEVREKLTPKLPWGSRRPIVSNVYYPTFNREQRRAGHRVDHRDHARRRAHRRRA